MNVRNKSIVLVDSLLGAKSSGLADLEIKNQEVVRLDPVQLFSKSDWTRFDQDIDVINSIYSDVFDEVVIENKKMVCFWPLSEQLGSDWFELNSLCKANSYELESYKNGLSNVDNYGFSEEVLTTWKKFIYFLIESLMEDIHLNEEFEEIATLTSDKGSIILFKLIQEGEEFYTFALNFEKEKSDTAHLLESQPYNNRLSPFASFRDMLMRLLNDKDLSLYQTRFFDPHLEKAYFNIMAQELKTKNLVESWILTYSMN